MLLSALAQCLGDELLEARGDCEVASLCMDNRKTEELKQALYFCIPGARFDGHDFAAQVVVISQLPIHAGIPEDAAADIFGTEISLIEERMAYTISVLRHFTLLQ